MDQGLNTEKQAQLTSILDTQMSVDQEGNKMV